MSFLVEIDALKREIELLKPMAEAYRELDSHSVDEAIRSMHSDYMEARVDYENWQESQ